MIRLRLTDEQVLDLFRQLPATQKIAALLALAQDARQRREERIDQAEAALRRLAAERGLDWDSMDDDQRLDMIDDMIHEDRQCPG